MSDLYEKHMNICKQLNETYKQKNRAYGDSFTRTYKSLGIISAVTRISDKFNRLVNLAVNKQVDIGDEPIKDTLLDMANYCIMTYMEICREEEEQTKQSNNDIDG